MTTTASFNGATSQGRGRHADVIIENACPELQWGHVSRTWKTLHPVPKGNLMNMLQWGHVSRTWKTGRRGVDQPQMFRALQWGHVSRTWKTRPNVGELGPRALASMGPRLKDVEDPIWDWNADRLYTLQWGHVSRTWKTGRIEPRAWLRARFNGATSQGRGRRFCSRRGDLADRRASMGPRLKDVEDSPTSISAATKRPRFNGATSQGRGRLDSLTFRTRHRPRFNGATSQGRGRRWGQRQPEEQRQSFNGATSQGRGRRHVRDLMARNPQSFNGATSQGRGRPVDPW